VVGVVDAGFTDDGDRLVEHVAEHYGTTSIDFFLVSHPDGDHINGAGQVMRGLNVGTLLIHRPGLHGYPGNSGDEPASELVALALEQGTQIVEPFTDVHGFGGSFLIAGPTEAYYEQLLAEQETTAKTAAARPSFAQRYMGAAVATVRKIADAFPAEIFFDDAGGTNPRNNSAAILSLALDGKHFLLPSDAGVPAITAALDELDARGRTALPFDGMTLPHHGSRHNLDRDTIERLLGSPTGERRGAVFASVSAESSNPSPRVANACGRRGYPVFTTAGSGVLHASGIQRPGWTAIQPLPPLAETDHDD
jgi:beta-lactamase superfamily II metal-dependent hydrolase